MMRLRQVRGQDHVHPAGDRVPSGVAALRPVPAPLPGHAREDSAPDQRAQVLDHVLGRHLLHAQRRLQR